MNQNWQKPSPRLNWTRFYSMVTILVLITSVVGLEMLRVSAHQEVAQSQSPRGPVNKKGSAKHQPATNPQVPMKKAVNKATAKGFAEQLRPFLANTNAKVAVAVYSKRDHQLYEATNTKQTTFPSASIIKTDFLVELLHQHHQKASALTIGEQNATVQMIENSDNDAATSIYNDIGSARGLGQLFNNLKMTNSTALASGWALTPTTPRDQIKVLNKIFYENGYISNKSKAYTKNLMANVADDQDWGISAGSEYAWLKNGWKQMPNGHWIVNSIGYLGKGENSCTIAIMSEDNPSLESGEALLEKLSQQVGVQLKIAGAERKA